MEKQEKKERKILTENRLATVNKHETSFEGLSAKMESGEDGVYNLFQEPDKNVLLSPKISITKKDLEEIPPLRALRDAITRWEEKLKKSSGKEAYIIKKALIEMRKDQYIIKNFYRNPVQTLSFFSAKFPIPLEEKITVSLEDQRATAEGISLLNPKIISIILCNYSALKQECWDRFDDDLWYLLRDFDHVSDLALTNYPTYERIVDLKIDGLSNAAIQEELLKDGIYYSAEYISSLWRNKIPKLLASKAEDLYLDYYFLDVAPGRYKKCSRCGQIKLANNKNFSKNKTSKDLFYSICKECRKKCNKDAKNVKE